MPSAPATRERKFNRPGLSAPLAWLAFGGCVAAALILLTLSGPVAHAATCASENNYTGAPGGNWNKKENWSKNAVPTATETVCIPAAEGTITVPASSTATAKILIAQSPITIEKEATLTIAEVDHQEEPKLEEERASTFAGLTVDGVLASDGAWILMTGAVVVEGEVKSVGTEVSRNEDIMRLLSGTLTGAGKFDFHFANIGGTMEPGGPGAIGKMHFALASDQAPGGTLDLDIAGPLSFDEIIAEAGFTWEGTLDVKLLGGYEPAVGTDFEFQKDGGTIGAFETVTPGWQELPLGGDDTVIVKTKPPSAVTEAATEVTQTSAVLHGSVNPNTVQIIGCEFELGTSNKYGLEAGGCPVPPEKGASPVAESTSLINLTPGTTYHFRITARNHEGGESQGADRTFTTLAASKESTGGETKGGSNAGTGGGETLGSTTGTVKNTEELLRGCSTSQLVLNDAYIHGSRVALLGTAAASLAGQKVKILFNEKTQVATATVGTNGQFSTTAPLPPKKIREALTTRYSAEIGSVRSLHVKLTRRLLLEPPKASGTTVTLTGTVTPPLTKPIAPIVVEERLQCGKTIIAARVTPPKSGRFKITVTVPAGTRAALYQLKSTVAANPHATKHGFTTFSLQLPVSIG
jgi:hypothetical protein